MRAIEAALSEDDGFRELRRLWDQAQSIIGVDGLADAAKGAVIHALGGSSRYRLILTHSEQRMREIVEAFRFYDRNTFAWPSKDVIFFQADIRRQSLICIQLKRRILTLYQ